MPGISCTRWLCWISLILFGSSQMKSWKPQRMVVCTIFWQWIQYFPVPHGKELSQPICPSPLWVQVLIELSSSSPYRTNSISSASSRAQRARSDSAVNSVSLGQIAVACCHFLQGCLPHLVYWRMIISHKTIREKVSEKQRKFLQSLFQFIWSLLQAST